MGSLGSAICFAGILLLKSGSRKHDVDSRHDSTSMILHIQQRLQDDINKIVDWTSDNKMVLNASKTKNLLVTGKRLEKKAPNTTLN